MAGVQSGAADSTLPGSASVQVIGRPGAGPQEAVVAAAAAAEEGKDLVGQREA